MLTIQDFYNHHLPVHPQVARRAASAGYNFMHRKQEGSSHHNPQDVDDSQADQLCDDEQEDFDQYP
jgi:hypothetical protein